MMVLLTQICWGRWFLSQSLHLGLLGLWAIVSLLLMSEFSLGTLPTALSLSSGLFSLFFVFLYIFKLFAAS